MRVENMGLSTPPGHALDSANLRKHATEFEGILLTEMLGKLQKTFAQTERESDAGNDAAFDTVSGLGTQALAQALAERGVIGIGEMITQSLSGTTTQVTSVSLHSSQASADRFDRTEK